MMNRLRSNVMSSMDELWDDIDDDVLIQMSQLAEEKSSFRVESQNDAEIMVLNEYEDDWNLDEVNKERFNQMQTQFPMTARNTFKRPSSPLSKVSFKKRRDENEFVDVQQLIEENRKLKDKNSMLNEEIYSKRGEVALLRSDIRKREAEIERERHEKISLSEQKAQEFNKTKAEFEKNADSIKTDNQFLQHQLTQAEEKIRRIETIGDSTSTSADFCKRTPERRSNQFPEHDVSTMVIDTKRSSPPKRPRCTKEFSCQTQIKTENPFSLKTKYLREPVSSACLITLVGTATDLSFLSSDSHLLARLSCGKELLKSCFYIVESILKVPDPCDEHKLISNYRTARYILETSEVRDKQLSSEILDNMGKLLLKFQMDGGNMSCSTVATPLLISSFELGKIILRNRLVNEEDFKTYLITFKQFLKHVNCLEMAKSITDFLSGSADYPEVAKLYCQVSKNSCFIFELCSMATRVSSTSTSENDEAFCALMGTFLNFLLLHISAPYELNWIGSLPKKVACNSCRMDTLKTLSLLTVKAVQQIRRLRSRGESPTDYQTECLKVSIHTLHQLWITDPNFVQNLSDSPGSQREYIWATKELSKLEHIIHLNVDERLMLDDLNVQYDQG